MNGTELLNCRSSESVVSTLRHGNDLFTHLFGIGAPSARSMAIISDTSNIRRSVSSIHQCGGFFFIVLVWARGETGEVSRVSHYKFEIPSYFTRFKVEINL